MNTANMVGLAGLIRFGELAKVISLVHVGGTLKPSM